MKPPNVIRVRKLRNANAVLMSQNIPQNSLVAPSYGQKEIFVGWVPDRQNESPTDKMAPSAPKNGHIPGPRDAWDPKQGSVGPHSACIQICLTGVSPRTAPKTGKIHFLAFLAHSGP